MSLRRGFCFDATWAIHIHDRIATGVCRMGNAFCAIHALQGLAYSWWGLLQVWVGWWCGVGGRHLQWLRLSEALYLQTHFEAMVRRSCRAMPT